MWFELMEDALVLPCLMQTPHFLSRGIIWENTTTHLIYNQFKTLKYFTKISEVLYMKIAIRWQSEFQGIYIIITKNIHYLLWNRGAWHFFHETYLTIEVQGIRCTTHLHDSCPLTHVNPHFTAPGCRYYFKINSLWPIVTSPTHGPPASHCDGTIAHCSHGYPWMHDVEVGAS